MSGGANFGSRFRVAGSLAFAGLIIVAALSAARMDSLPLPLVVAALVVAMAAGVWFNVEYWRRLDEAAREAHKWAWFWGATMGVALAGVSLPLLHLTPLGVEAAADLGFTGPRELMSVGMLYVLVLQMAGYMAFWIFWWARKR